MKTMLVILTVLMVSNVFAMNREELIQLLKVKNISLVQMEQSGAMILLGEVTGHIRAVPFNSVKVIITQNEAILRNEIESAEFQGKELLGNLKTVRYQGQYATKEDVKAVIVTK